MGGGREDYGTLKGNGIKAEKGRKLKKSNDGEKKED